MKSITVEAAIKRGKWLCLFLPLIFFAIPMLAGVCLMKYYDDNFLFLVAGFVAAILFSFLIWGFTSVRWKIWAYTHVRNVHELQRRAINEKLIWNDGNFFNRFEIKSAEQRIALKKLEARFEEADELHDDVTVANASYFYISKKSMYIKLVLGIAALGFGIYLYFNANSPKEKFLVYAAPVVAVMLIYQGYKGLRNKKPILILDEEGIRLQERGLMPWEDVYDVDVFVKDKEDILSFNHNGETIDVKLEDIDVKAAELRRLVETYRARHLKNASGIYEA